MNTLSARAPTLATQIVVDEPRVNQPQQRLLLLDVAKGVCILLVVLGHNAWIENGNEYINNALSTFRLPFFFFVAGVTFPSARGIGVTIAKRTDAMLKPFWVVICGLAAWQFVEGHLSAEHIFLELVYATGFTLDWVPLWFIPHLWLVSIIVALIVRAAHPALNSSTFKTAVLVMVLVVGVATMRSFDGPSADGTCLHIETLTPELLRCGLPFSADVALVSSFFMLLGFFVAEHVKRFQPSNALVALGALTFAVLFLAFHATISLNHRRYDQIVVSTIEAITGIYLLLALCAGLSHQAPLRKILAYVGSGSLFVLLFHSCIQNKATDLLTLWGLPLWTSGTIAYVIAVGGSLAAWEVTKRNRLLSVLLLPRKG